MNNGLYRHYKKYQWLVLTVLTMTVTLFTDYFFWGNDLGVIVKQEQFFSGKVFAQSITPEMASREVYRQIPDFPLENNYINSQTREVASENTLVTRIVRYHQYTKSRPTIYRLDWKLTLADYLGKNEIIDEARYPNTTLTENPLERDRQVIQSLTRQQRNQLVDVLVNIYNPQVNSETENNQQPPQNQQPIPPRDSSSFQLPRKGGADLLLP